ncbi:hypothetical protein LJR097_001630 [Phenylobacterium sp. LjRoot97]
MFAKSNKAEGLGRPGLRVLGFVSDDEIGTVKDQIEGFSSGLESLPPPTFWGEQRVELVDPTEAVGGQEDEAAMLGAEWDGSGREIGDQLWIMATQKVGQGRM